MSPNEQLRTFISYSRVNQQFALKLACELKSAGFSIWMDQFDIPTGRRWDDEIEKALLECEIFLIIMTPASIASENAKDEIGYAIDHNKRIMPVLLENCEIPLRLRRLQYVDFTQKNFAEGISSAKELLSKLVNEESFPAPAKVSVGKDSKVDSSIEINSLQALAHGKEKSLGIARQRLSTKSIAMIGGAVLFVLILIGGVLYASLHPVLVPSPTVQTQAIKPSNTPAPAVTATIADTPLPVDQRFYIEEFDGDLASWIFYAKSGRENEFKRYIKNGRLVIQIQPQKDTPWGYLIRTDFKYTDVQLEAVVINNGNNGNGVSLVCRYSDKGWYEFEISNDGSYSIYAFGPNGAILKNGYELARAHSPAIKTGREENVFTATCKGNELSLAVNGTPIKTVNTKYDFTEGSAGMGFSAPQNLPVDVEFESVKITEP